MLSPRSYYSSGAGRAHLQPSSASSTVSRYELRTRSSTSTKLSQPRTSVPEGARVGARGGREGGFQQHTARACPPPPPPSSASSTSSCVNSARGVTTCKHNSTFLRSKHEYARILCPCRFQGFVCFVSCRVCFVSFAPPPRKCEVCSLCLGVFKVPGACAPARSPGSCRSVASAPGGAALQSHPKSKADAHFHQRQNDLGGTEQAGALG